MTDAAMHGTKLEAFATRLEEHARNVGGDTSFERLFGDEAWDGASLIRAELATRSTRDTGMIQADLASAWPERSPLWNELHAVIVKAIIADCTDFDGSCYAAGDCGVPSVGEPSAMEVDGEFCPGAIADAVEAVFNHRLAQSDQGEAQGELDPDIRRRLESVCNTLESSNNTPGIPIGFHQLAHDIRAALSTHTGQGDQVAQIVAWLRDPSAMAENHVSSELARALAHSIEAGEPFQDRAQQGTGRG